MYYLGLTSVCTYKDVNGSVSVLNPQKPNRTLYAITAIYWTQSHTRKTLGMFGKIQNDITIISLESAD